VAFDEDRSVTIAMAEQVQAQPKAKKRPATELKPAPW
jgi:hypothetical protein